MSGEDEAVVSRKAFESLDRVKARWEKRARAAEQKLLGIKGVQAELEWMNAQWAELKAKHDALEATVVKLRETESGYDKQLEALKRKLETAEYNAKAEKDYAEELTKARDEWKAFGTAMALHLHVISGVVEGVAGDEAAAVRQLVLAAKKVPHPPADQTHPSVWKFAVLGGLGMIGAMAWIYTSMRTGKAAPAAGPTCPAGAP